VRTRLREGEAHLAARPVRQPAHRIDRLEGRARGDQHRAALQHLRLEERNQFGEQLFGLEHAAVADLAAGLVATRRAEDDGAVGTQLRGIPLRRRMRPHLAVHRRREQQRTALDRPRQAQQAQQIAGPTLRELSHQVGARRRDQHRIGRARQVDVRHVVRLARIPLRGDDRTTRQRLHRHRGDEVLGCLGHHDLHRGTGLRQLADQLGRLVAGDATGEAEHHMPAGQIERRRGRHGVVHRMHPCRRIRRVRRDRKDHDTLGIPLNR
jgi:hypothetical protein